MEAPGWLFSGDAFLLSRGPRVWPRGQRAWGDQGPGGPGSRAGSGPPAGRGHDSRKAGLSLSTGEGAGPPCVFPLDVDGKVSKQRGHVSRARWITNVSLQNFTELGPTLPLTRHWVLSPSPGRNIRDASQNNTGLRFSTVFLSWICFFVICPNV